VDKYGETVCEYTYDALGRIVRQQYGNYEIAYSYNGNIVTEEVYYGTEKYSTFTTTYDDNGRLIIDDTVLYDDNNVAMMRHTYYYDYDEHGNTLLLRKLGIRRRRWRGWEDIAAAWAEGFGIHLVCAAFGTFHRHRSFPIVLYCHYKPNLFVFQEEKGNKYPQNRGFGDKLASNSPGPFGNDQSGDQPAKLENKHIHRGQQVGCTQDGQGQHNAKTYASGENMDPQPGAAGAPQGSGTGDGVGHACQSLGGH
jgi:hypothetical protein